MKQLSSQQEGWRAIAITGILILILEYLITKLLPDYKTLVGSIFFGCYFVSVAITVITTRNFNK